MCVHCSDDVAFILAKYKNYFHATSLTPPPDRVGSSKRVIIIYSSPVVRYTYCMFTNTFVATLFHVHTLKHNIHRPICTNDGLLYVHDVHVVCVCGICVTSSQYNVVSVYMCIITPLVLRARAPLMQRAYTRKITIQYPRVFVCIIRVHITIILRIQTCIHTPLLLLLQSTYTHTHIINSVWESWNVRRARYAVEKKNKNYNNEVHVCVCVCLLPQQRAATQDEHPAHTHTHTRMHAYTHTHMHAHTYLMIVFRLLYAIVATVEVVHAGTDEAIHEYARAYKCRATLTIRDTTDFTQPSHNAYVQYNMFFTEFPAGKKCNFFVCLSLLLYT